MLKILLNCTDIADQLLSYHFKPSMDRNVSEFTYENPVIAAHTAI